VCLSVSLCVSLSLSVSLSFSVCVSLWSRAVTAVREAVDFHARVAPELLAERSTAAGLANQAWITARTKGDFALFQSHLEKVSHSAHAQFVVLV
jgi:Zn-dependent M32 family carboxypeptidase